MPSPFPGMDPYLEDPGLWPDVHHEIISVTREFLGARLRPKYYVRIEERVYVSDDLGSDPQVRVPDVQITRRPGGGVLAEPGGGGVAVEVEVEEEVEVAEPVQATTSGVEVREAFLKVIDREDRAVVAVIEVLSPTNKVPGSPGLESFEQKRREVLASPSHWVEIDLLRGGRSLPARRHLRPCEYLVHVSKASQRPEGLLWPIRLSQRLPVIPIPLRPEDPEAPLDLQAVLSTAYDRAGYDLELNYRAEPVPPLPPEWADWTNRRLLKKGLRGT